MRAVFEAKVSKSAIFAFSGYVLRTCRSCSTLAEAGRRLFAVSRQRRRTINDADRVRKYLVRFDLIWNDVRLDRHHEAAR